MDNSMSRHSLQDIAFDKPKYVRHVLEALYITTGKHVVDGCAASVQKGLLRNYSRLENEMARIDREGIDDDIYENLKPYLSDPSLDPHKAKGASLASGELAAWLSKVYSRHSVKRYLAEMKGKGGGSTAFNSELLEYLK